MDVSRLFIYYNTRKKDNRKEGVSRMISDTGSSITSAIETLQKKGVCLEDIWPYDEKEVNTKPSKKCYEQAKSYVITEALTVKPNLNEMKSCLAQGFPIVFTLRLFKSFAKAKKNGGKVPLPNSKDTRAAKHSR